MLSTIESAQKQGQFDNTQLTLRDLSIITESFVNVLRGTHHPSELPFGISLCTSCCMTAGEIQASLYTATP